MITKYGLVALFFAFFDHYDDFRYLHQRHLEK